VIQRNDYENIYDPLLKEQKQQRPLQYDDQNNSHPYPLSLGSISPTWAGRLKEKRSSLFLLSLTRLTWLFQILHQKKCVVAEAYGFSSSYTNNCPQCARIANKFSLYFTMNLLKKLEENQNRFVKHWNEKHLKI
jgi:hypothetical protein